MQNDNNSSMGIIVGVLLVIVVIVAGIFFLTRNNTATTTTNTTTTTTTPPAAVSSKTFTMSAQNGSGQDGTVLLEEVGSQVRVTITLSSPVTTAEPAHIHSGTCPTPGAVVYPLSDVVNGSSVTMITASLASLKAAQPLAVNVHKSAAESGTYFSCGNVTL